eukprot:Seg3074.2 transcript_id=Seg3074.2/GoldUCD/mRNA.D3Y31 product="F-box/LRR-repeat protein 20" protein_id=Seg3074.2/GoldUCD/D3Y31
MEDTYGRKDRIGKRMAYLLRYGALKEGLEADAEGFVKLDDLLKAGLMRHHCKEEVFSEVKKVNVAGKSRFEIVSKNDVEVIRAAYGRKFAPAPKHKNSEVSRLLEICLSYVSKNIKLYDLEDFPEEYLLSRIYYRLKYEKKLTNSVMQNVIGKMMDSVDFNGIYITEKTLKMLCKRCPNLKSLDLKTCEYLITDTVLRWLLKSLTKLENLNLCGCKSITDNGIEVITKHTLQVERLNFSHLPLVTEKGLRKLVSLCMKLKQLNLQGNPCADKALVEELLGMREKQDLIQTRLKIYADYNTKTIEQ